MLVQGPFNVKQTPCQLLFLSFHFSGMNFEELFSNPEQLETLLQTVGNITKALSSIALVSLL